MLNNIIKILLLILFFTLPIIHSRIFDFFGLSSEALFVNGNFEFTKVMYFNILSGIIFIFFILNNIINKKNIIIPKILIYILSLLFISSIFSISIYNSIFINLDKAHDFIMFINLIGIYIILINIDKNFIKKLFYTSIISGIIVSLVGIKELGILSNIGLEPSYDYGDLKNRLLSTFGHPNYVVLYLLLLIPYILYNIKNIFIKYIIFTIILIAIILTKSVWGNIIFLLIINYYLFNKYKLKKKNNYNIKHFFIIHFLLIIFGFLIILKFFPEKLQSFLSRFYIWKSTFSLITDSIKSFFLGYGFENLNLVFNKSKSIYLYIYENINFSADRPHNLLLNIWFSLGFFGVILFLYILKNFFKKIKKIDYYIILSILIFLLFTIFNFASIGSYLLLMLIISQISISKKIKNKYLIFITITTIFLVSLFGLYNSCTKYISETYFHQNKIKQVNNFFKYNLRYILEEKKDYKNALKIIGFESEYYLKQKIINLNNININCTKLTQFFPIAENYFYCGKIYEILNKKDLSNIYYKQGLSKLPDLWNNNSHYFNNKTIDKKTIQHRFLSEKYSNIKDILKKIDINN